MFLQRGFPSSLSSDNIQPAFCKVVLARRDPNYVQPCSEVELVFSTSYGFSGLSTHVPGE